MADNTDIVTQLQQVAQQLGRWVQAFQGRQLFGSFTMTAASSQIISNYAVAANSVIMLIPTNAAAATLQAGASSLYATPTAGTGFTVNTANGGSAAGTETFQYVVTTPV